MWCYRFPWIYIWVIQDTSSLETKSVLLNRLLIAFAVFLVKWLLLLMFGYKGALI